jgi:hypothetical protein
MRSSILLTFLFFILPPTFADNWTGVSTCGIYLAKGIVRSTHDGLGIIVNEKTQSEIVIHVPIQNEAFLAPYLDRAMTASVAISRLSPNLKIEAIVKAIASRIPNPLNPMDSGIKLIGKTECK